MILALTQVQITLAAIGTYESAGLIHQMATLNATKLLLKLKPF